MSISIIINGNISCQEQMNVFANWIRLWLGWWWDALFLHLLSSIFYYSGSLNNRGGQVRTVTIVNGNLLFSFQTSFQTKIVICIVISDNILLSKVFPSKEETPAHSRHPLPPIFLSPTSSRQLKVTLVRIASRDTLR